jgi:hypothetical protein
LQHISFTMNCSGCTHTYHSFSLLKIVRLRGGILPVTVFMSTLFLK